MKKATKGKILKNDKSKGELDLKTPDFASAIVDNTSEAITVINLKGEVLFWNNGASELSGYSNDDVIGKHISMFYRKQDLPDLLDRIKKAIQGEYFTNKELILLDKNKKEHTVLLTLNGLKDKSGEVTQLVGFIKDITEKVKAEEVLKVSMDDLERIFNLSAYMVGISTPDGIFQKVSPAFTETLGFSEKEFLSQPFINFVHPDDKKATLDNMEPLARGIPIIRFANRYICKDGSYKWLEWTGRSFVTGGEIYSIAYDITDRKKAEEELKESEEKYRSMIASAPSFINSINKDYKIIDLNYTVEGVPKEKIIGQPIFNFVDKEFHKILKSCLDKSFNKGEKSFFESKALGPNNTISWYESKLSPIKDTQGNITYTMMIANDITEKKQAEKKLKESEERIRIFTKNVPDFLLQIDSTGKINYINKTLEGLTQKDVIGSSVYSWVPEEFSEEFKGKVEKVFRSGSSEIIEYSGNGLKGEPIWFESKIGPLKISGIITQVIIVSRDITQRKQAEEELLKSAQLLEASQTVAKLGGWELDLATKDLFWTSETYRIHETSPEEFNPTVDAGVSYFLPESRQIISEALQVAMERGEGYDLELETYTTKGRLINIRTTCEVTLKEGKPAKLTGIFQDITKQKKAENELTELKQQIEAENIYLKEELKLEGSFDEIIGSNKSLIKILNQVEKVAKTDTTVLILGETGTGKELIAKAIHNASDRKNKPLIKVNCSALPTELIESELFGHEKGAFTGAINRKIGRFELANGGTIFLDEIGDLPIGLQSRLLRVLQESEFERVGGEKTIKVDVRVITATNRNLANQVLENKFRQDLYYRLNVFPITCPPLRDRIDDIQSLVHHFVNKYNPKVSNKIKTVNQKTIAKLMHYNWPGNIRELEHVIERAIIVNKGGQLRLGKWFMDNSLDTIVSDDLRTLETLDRDYIIMVLKKTNWRIRGKNGASVILGLKPTTLEARIKKLNINRIN